MNYYLLLISLLFFSIPLSAQQQTIDSDTKSVAFKAFEPLLNRTWQADANWENGQQFKQTIHFTKALNSQIILVETQGFTDETKTAWGPRNHGIRRWDAEQQRMEFQEFDAFGGLTTGYLSFIGDSVFYHYKYGDQFLTDAWLPIDANTYQFVVGVREEAHWKSIFLQTQFIAIMPLVSPDSPDAPLPYREIPAAPEVYNACTVVARMIDGLGFRYYWATENLQATDLAYKASPEGRTVEETIAHIHGLTEVIHHAVAKQAIIRGEEQATLSFAAQRRETLFRLQAASTILRQSHPGEIENFKLIFQRGERKSEFPFWNNLNGPLADALWHVGQVVMLRRAAGNPLDSRVSVFQGKLRE